MAFPMVIATASATAPPAADDSSDPVTLHRIMQTMIGEGLRQHFRPPKKLSHELFVLLLQLKEEERRRERRAAASRKAAAKTRADAVGQAG